MPNISRIVSSVATEAAVPYTIYMIETTYDTLGDHTILTPGATLANTVTGVPTLIPTGKWFIVGMDYQDSVDRTMLIKSGSRTIFQSELPAGMGIGIGVGSMDYWMAGKKGDALVVNIDTTVTPNVFYTHVVVADNYKGYTHD